MKETVKKSLSLLVIPAAIASGFLFAFLLSLYNKVDFGIYLWPLILSVAVFAFSTTGFFAVEGKPELLYGFCSMAAAACAIVQMALLF